jgi:cytochrome c oxidase assembly factor CtaG
VVRPDPFSWSLHADALLAIALLTAAYVVALRRFPTSRGRIASFAAGVALLVAIAVTPLHALSFHLLTAHLLQNVVLAEWAPALLVMGVSPGLAAAIARRRPIRALIHPAVALPLWLVTYYLWHLPVAYDAALRNPATLLHLEHACYLVTGCLLWWSVLQDEPWRLRSQTRALYLFLAFILASPLGLLLTFLPQPVYAFYGDGFAPWGLTALTDQQMAGVTMSAEQGFVFFAAFAYFFFRFLAEEEAVMPALSEPGRATPR